jgi:hypothetical protein
VAGTLLPTGRLRDLPASGTSAGRPRPGGVAEAQEALVLQIRAARAAQIERVQAVADAAVLAAEQVQDQRLDLLEKGPEVEISDVIFDALIGLALMGVGRALVPIADSISRELAKSMTWYASNGRNPRFAKLLGAGLRSIDAQLANARLDAADIKRRHQQVRELLTSKFGEGLELFGERARGAAEEGLSLGTKRVELEPTDSPGVAMLAAAQAYVSQQRYALELFHDGFEAIVRAGAAGPGDLAGIEAAATPEVLDQQVVEIRDRHKLLFEAAIWVRLFNFDGQIQAGPFGRLEFGGLPRPLQRYLRRRFARTVERWMTGVARDAHSEYAVRSNPDVGLDLREYGTVSNETGRGIDKFRPTPLGQLDTTKQDAAIHRFFVTVTRDFTAVRRAQGTDGSGADGMRLREPLQLRKEEH